MQFDVQMAYIISSVRFSFIIYTPSIYQKVKFKAVYSDRKQKTILLSTIDQILSISQCRKEEDVMSIMSTANHISTMSINLKLGLLHLPTGNKPLVDQSTKYHYYHNGEAPSASFAHHMLQQLASPVINGTSHTQCECTAHI